MLLPPVHPVRPIPLPIVHELLPLALQAVLFIVLLVVASAIDIRRRIIPNSVCAGIALAGLIHFSPANLFGILAALPLLVAAMCKQGSIGGGDIKLAAACGFVLGFSDGITGLCLCLAAMLLFHAGSGIVGRMKQDDKTESLPMAPFLSIGFIAIYMLKIAGL